MNQRTSITIVQTRPTHKAHVVNIGLHRPHNHQADITQKKRTSPEAHPTDAWYPSCANVTNLKRLYSGFLSALMISAKGSPTVAQPAVLIFGNDIVKKRSRRSWLIRREHFSQPFQPVHFKAIFIAPPRLWQGICAAPRQAGPHISLLHSTPMPSADRSAWRYRPRIRLRSAPTPLCFTISAEAPAMEPFSSQKDTKSSTSLETGVAVIEVDRSVSYI